MTGSPSISRSRPQPPVPPLYSENGDVVRPPQKGDFWYQKTDAAMYRYLLVRLAIGIGVGTIAWFAGHLLLKLIMPHPR